MEPNGAKNPGNLWRILKCVVGIMDELQGGAQVLCLCGFP